MAGIMLLIFVGLICAMVIATNLTAWLGGHLPLLRDLADRFPPQVPDADAARTSCGVVIWRAPEESPDPRRHVRPARPHSIMALVALDSSYLHLALDSGALGPKRSASIPLESILVSKGESVRHAGDVSVIRADRFFLGLPSHVVEPLLEGADGAIDVDYREIDAEKI